jgi:1-deoxy-D-xylulose-5-phosphate synthase
VVKGGFGTTIADFGANNSYKANIKTLGIPDEFLEQGTINELQQYCNIDVESLTSYLRRFLI